jgi:hypothetical protein
VILQVTDGTTTVQLSGAAPIAGCTYFPSTPQRTNGQYGDVTETAEVVLRGTAAQIRTAVNSLERLFEQAARRAAGALQARVYVQYTPVDADAVWRSEVLEGRVTWSSDPGLRRLGETTPTVKVAVFWRRRFYWEGAEEIDAGTVHMTNGDVAGEPDVGDWIGPAGPVTYSAAFGITEGDNAYNAGEWTAIEGVLPTPAHLRLTNEDGAPVTVKRVYIANDVYARFDGFQHAIQSGDTKSWTTSSTHATARWTLALPAAQIAKLVAGGGVRLLAVMTSISAGVYLRAQLQQVSTGPVVTAAWTGPEALTASGRLVYDLGYVQMPPGVTTFADWYLVITVYAGATGSGVLDFVQFCPGGELVTLEGPGIAWADAAIIDWWGDERYAVIDDFHASLGAVGRLLLYPERANRLMVLVESSTGVDATALMALQVKYRPRRATI